jgi:hypothetical protein
MPSSGKGEESKIRLLSRIRRKPSSSGCTSARKVGPILLPNLLYKTLARLPLLWIVERQVRHVPKPDTVQFGVGEAVSLDKILAYSNGILERKYDLYMWCEAKVGTLVTLDGLLLGGLFVIIKFNEISGFVDLSLLFLILSLMLSSLVISLWHTKPLMFSGRTRSRNLRTVIGTEAYSSSQEYLDEMMTLSIEKMIALNVEQIRGMNKNIWVDQKAINLGVRLTAFSVFPLVLLIWRIVGA